MNIAKLSIKRPILICSIVISIITLGIISFRDMGMDLMPDITFPVVTVTTIYPGATPEEIENLVAKPLEDEISIISGIKHVTSNINEGVSVIIIEFNLGIDLLNAEQQVRNKVSYVKKDLPDVKFACSLGHSCLDEYENMPKVAYKIECKL